MNTCKTCRFCKMYLWGDSIITTCCVDPPAVVMAGSVSTMYSTSASLSATSKRPDVKADDPACSRHEIAHADVIAERDAMLASMREDLAKRQAARRSK